MRFLLGIFVILHGLVYTLYFVPKPPDEKWPFVFERGWLYGKIGKRAHSIGKLLVLLAVAGFVIGGISLFIVPSVDILWKTSLVAAAGLALLFQLLFWQNQLFIGALINIVLLYGILIANWSF